MPTPNLDVRQTPLFGKRTPPTYNTGCAQNKYMYANMQQCRFNSDVWVRMREVEWSGAVWCAVEWRAHVRSTYMSCGVRKRLHVRKTPR